MVTVPETLPRTRRSNYLGIPTARQVLAARDRHYEELTPYSEACRERSTYGSIGSVTLRGAERYRNGPTRAPAEQLRADFTTRMPCPRRIAVGECVARTAARSARLLVVLDDPRVPTNNNICRTRRTPTCSQREVSFWTKVTPWRHAGTRCNRWRDRPQCGVNLHALLRIGSLALACAAARTVIVRRLCSASRPFPSTTG